MNLRLTRMCLLLLCGAILLTASAYCAQSPTQLNVKDFGAVGDGKTDDSAAILRAIEEGKVKMLPVCFPRGIYVVTKPITIENQSLVGDEPGAWNADSAPMPTLLIEQKSDPALTMKDGAAVHGLMLAYDVDKLSKCPPTISLSGGGISITNTRLQYCYDGIISDGKANCGRLNIENVFIVSPGRYGVYVARTYDIATIRNIEVWNNLHRQGVTAFKFGRNDGLRGSQLVSFGTDVGFELGDDDPEGGTWGSFVDCGTDACVVAWKATGKTGHTVSITGGFFWDHMQTILVDNPNVALRVSNAELQSNGAPVVQSSACSTLLLTSCRIARAYENPEVPFFDLQGVNLFTMGSCAVAQWSPIFKIGPNVKQASITGNVFQASPFARIFEDKRGKDSDIIIANNSGMKPTPAAAKGETK